VVWCEFVLAAFFEFWQGRKQEERIEEAWVDGGNIVDIRI
jgi:hypothetical protein